MIKIIGMPFYTYYISRYKVWEELRRKMYGAENFEDRNQMRGGLNILLNRIETAFSLFV